MEFAFKIGQFVRPKGVELSKKLWDAIRTEEEQKRDRFSWGEKDNGPIVLQVIGRMTDECSGGIQKNYTTRATWRTGYSDALVRFNEIELEAIPPELQ